jgi:general secretion pathway protein K
MNRRGSILVAVLLLASLLTVFVGVASERLRVASAATRGAAEDIAADVAVRGTLERLWAASGGRLANLPPVTGLSYPGIVVDVVAHNEGERIDLDLAPEELIAGLFRAVGVEEPAAARYARLIVDRRRDPRRPPAPGRPPSVPAQGVIEHVRELDAISQIPKDVLDAIRPFVTVTALDGRIAVLTAPREVVAALPGMSGAKLEAFMTDRVGREGDFDALLRRYGIARDHVSKVGSSAVRLTMVVRIGSHRIRGYEVVVATLPGDGEPYRILSWNGNALPAGVAGPGRKV